MGTVGTLGVIALVAIVFVLLSGIVSIIRADPYPVEELKEEEEKPRERSPLDL